MSVSDAIDRYVLDNRKAIARTKAQVHEAIKRFPIGDIGLEKVHA